MDSPQVSSPSAQQPPEGTFWDKAAPTEPPAPPRRNLPAHLGEIIRFFDGIIADEGLLLDLCLDRVVGIVEFNFKKRLVGIDLMAQDQPTALHFMGVAAPLTVELYKQVLAALNDPDRRAEYMKLVAEAQEEMKRAPSPVSRIIQP